MLRFLVLFVLFFESANTQLVPRASPEFGESRTAYDDFLDILRSSTPCSTYFDALSKIMNRPNLTSRAEEIRAVLSEHFMEMHSSGRNLELIRDILNLYCHAKSYVPLVLNNWTPPSVPERNYTWDMNQESPYTIHFHLARQLEEKYMNKFKKYKKLALNKNNSERESGYTYDQLANRCRILIALMVVQVTFAVLRSAYHFHYYYIDRYVFGEDIEEDELGEAIRRIDDGYNLMYCFFAILIILLCLASEYVKWIYGFDAKYATQYVFSFDGINL